MAVELRQINTAHVERGERLSDRAEAQVARDVVVHALAAQPDEDRPPLHPDPALANRAREVEERVFIAHFNEVGLLSLKNVQDVAPRPEHAGRQEQAIACVEEGGMRRAHVVDARVRIEVVNLRLRARHDETHVMVGLRRVPQQRMVELTDTA